MESKDHVTPPSPHRAITRSGILSLLFITVSVVAILAGIYEILDARREKPEEETAPANTLTTDPLGLTATLTLAEKEERINSMYASLQNETWSREAMRRDMAIREAFDSGLFGTSPDGGEILTMNYSTINDAYPYGIIVTANNRMMIWLDGVWYAPVAPQATVTP